MFLGHLVDLNFDFGNYCLDSLKFDFNTGLYSLHCHTLLDNYECDLLVDYDNILFALSSIGENKVHDSLSFVISCNDLFIKYINNEVLIMENKLLDEKLFSKEVSFHTTKYNKVYINVKYVRLADNKTFNVRYFEPLQKQNNK